MAVTASNYPASVTSQYLQKLVFAGQILIVALTLAGTMICEAVGIRTPNLVLGMMDNKMNFLMGAFLLGNMIQSNLMQTGAFEIAFDGHLIFSKLQSNRLPTFDELFDSINAIKARNTY